jgi:hypothetical protein
MSAKMTGGCHCGAVRYEITADPMFPGFCHCRDCQIKSGAPHVAAFAIPAKDMNVTGEVQRYTHKNNDGYTVGSNFCPNCGSRMFGSTTRMPEMVVIFTTSLDNPAPVKPGMHAFAASVQPWDRIDDGLPTFPGMPQLENA